MLACRLGEDVPMIAREIPGMSKPSRSLGAAFFWLSGFYFVYCIRPEDWIHPLGAIPLAKITGTALFFHFWPDRAGVIAGSVSSRSKRTTCWR